MVRAAGRSAGRALEGVRRQSRVIPVASSVAMSPSGSKGRRPAAPCCTACERCYAEAVQTMRPYVWVSPRPNPSGPGSTSCGGARGGCAGCCPAPCRLSRCAKMRLITAGSSMVAMTFILPPQVSQVSISILNTRCRRCAKGSSLRGSLPVAHSRSPRDAVRVGPGPLAHADDGWARTHRGNG